MFAHLPQFGNFNAVDSQFKSVAHGIGKATFKGRRRRNSPASRNIAGHENFKAAGKFVAQGLNLAQNSVQVIGIVVFFVI